MILYSKPHCDKCEDIKKLLNRQNVVFEERDTGNPAFKAEALALVADRPDAVMPIIKFDDGHVVSNDMGLYRELKVTGVLK
jgi:glutaredoxin